VVKISPRWENLLYIVPDDTGLPDGIHGTAGTSFLAAL